MEARRADSAENSHKKYFSRLFRNRRVVTAAVACTVDQAKDGADANKADHKVADLVQGLENSERHL